MATSHRRRRRRARPWQRPRTRGRRPAWPEGTEAPGRGSDLSERTDRARGRPIRRVTWPGMRIATWNVNSLRARMPRLLPWLEEHRPDVVCLQETKVADADFPHLDFHALGYE